MEFLAGRDIAVCATWVEATVVHRTGGFACRPGAGAAELLGARDLQCGPTSSAGCIPGPGQAVTEALDVPVIGIGAGPDTGGQIQVLYDILDITSGRKPRFVRNFMAGAGSPLAALQAYVAAVKAREYPAPEHCF
jgi:3-methyl-2-oxobutanoate hydroxymethyltransferase